MARHKEPKPPKTDICGVQPSPDPFVYRLRFDRANNKRYLPLAEDDPNLNAVLPRENLNAWIEEFNQECIRYQLSEGMEAFLLVIGSLIFMASWMVTLPVGLTVEGVWPGLIALPVGCVTALILMWVCFVSVPNGKLRRAHKQWLWDGNDAWRSKGVEVVAGRERGNNIPGQSTDPGDYLTYVDIRLPGATLTFSKLSEMAFDKDFSRGAQVRADLEMKGPNPATMNGAAQASGGYRGPKRDKSRGSRRSRDGRGNAGPNCSYCSKPVGTAKFCPECGTPVAPPQYHDEKGEPSAPPPEKYSFQPNEEGRPYL